MAIAATLAPAINSIQRDSFYFTILFRPDAGEIDTGGFALSNIQISAATDIRVSDLSLLYLEGNHAVIGVDLPDNVTGTFTVSLTGMVSVNDGGVVTQEELISAQKVIEYDSTAGITQTLDTTPPPTEVTEIGLSLSSKTIENSGIVIVLVELDYPYPAFTSAVVSVSAGTKSAATAIDDDNKRWILLVTVPSSGSGTIDVSIAEDAIGTHEAVDDVEIEYAANIPLTIGNTAITVFLKTVLNVAIPIRGNNISKVDVHGLLAGYGHNWDATAGFLYLRGTADEELSDFKFVVEARDENDEAMKLGTLTVTRAAPAIIVPTEPIGLFFGNQVDVEFEVTNNPTSVTVEGTFMFLESRLRDGKINIYGRIPQKGTGPGQWIPGTLSGNFRLGAKNSGGDATPKLAAWQLLDGVTPQFVAGAITAIAEQNEAYTDTIEVTGSPEPTITVESGSLPTGLTLATAESDGKVTISFEGMPTATGAFTFKLRATNNVGMVISGSYTITVYTNFIAPSTRSAPTGLILLSKTRQFPYNVASFFNRGVPTGTFSISGTNANLYSITPEGSLTLTAAGLLAERESPITVRCTNSEGHVDHTFNIYLGSF